MEWLEIRTALVHMKPPFPHAAVSEARLHWNELAPRFITEIERVKGLLRSYEEWEREQAAQQGRAPVSFDFLWRAIGLKRTDH